MESTNGIVAGEEDLHTALTFLELTTVHYKNDDPYGWINAYITLIPIAIAIGVLTLILFKREVRTIAVFMGLLFSETCNYILKKSIKENRPSYWKELKKQSYGMPSSHSQFMFFFAVLMTLFILKHRIRIKNRLIQLALIIGLYVLALFVAYSRVHLFYHTTKQVVFGSFTGIILGAFWFVVVENILRPYIFPFFINHPIGKFFYLRDSSDIENLLEFEYYNVINAQSKKNNKNNKKKE
ncbi:dolichyldiphosphatase 1 [Tieghemostelium lacteum]|uniref:Dolichyldiphosphatase n=1 Tax=Tieghemostelium lacteum TaxID=361077 RepID=A0A151ZEZ3_TIELA|nr:dolichyldiphosphatase 1 [Tieghemostelium lacteum]|eukprot:KYQ92480.1 dolichyldiphosphatase 1 [Tieghemostelium lacteum]